MPFQEISFKLPEYHNFADTLEVLSLSVSVSELHGIMCGYLTAGEISQGDAYIRSLLTGHKNSKQKEATLALFNVYTISQHQISTLDLDFQLMLPGVEEDLSLCAEAFSYWCSGFVEGLSLAGVSIQEIEGKDVKDAILHINQFSHLDYESLSINAEDEKALLDVCEYTRMAVLQIYSAIQQQNFGDNIQTSH